LIRAAIVTLLVLSGCGNSPANGQSPASRPASGAAAGPAALARAYPDHVASVDATHVVMRDGTRLAISDGIAGKTRAERLRRPDIDDMFADPYVFGRPQGPPQGGEDPGRARNEPFFDRVYGDCRRGEVSPRLRNVRWMPGRGGTPLQVTTVNDVAGRLEAVIRDLDRLPPAMTRYLVPSAGTYNCRVIAGTDQRSMHAYGVAIDINVSSPITGAGRAARAPATATASPGRSSKCSNGTASSGAANGAISTPCISNTAPS
jgi:hypothetical protein